MNPKLAKKSIELAVYAALLTVPLVFSKISYNFIYIKEITLMLAAGFAAAGLISLPEIKVNRIHLIAAAFIAWMGVSYLVNMKAFGHAAGPVFIKAAAAWLFLVAVSQEGVMKKEKLKSAFVWFAAPALLAGLLQGLGAKAMEWFSVFGSRVPSTLGNPNFFGAYAAVVIPFSLDKASRGSAGRKALYYTLTAIAAVCVLLTGSKAAVIAALAAALIYELSKIKEKRRVAYAVSAVAILAAVLAYSLRENIAENESVMFRKNVWAGSAAMTAAKPFFGSGPGSFYLAFPPYRPHELMKWASERSYEVTHPENMILQASSETGIPGAVIILALLAAVVAAARKEPAFLAGMSALIATNLFGVDINYAPSVLLAVLMAACCGEPLLRLGGGGKRAAAIAAAAAGILILLPAARMYFSDVYLKQAVFFSRVQNWNAAEKSYKRSLELNPDNVVAMYFLACAVDDSLPEKDTEGRLKLFTELEKKAPNYVLAHYRTAHIYRDAGDTVNAKKYYEKMLAIDPYMKPAVQELAFLYYSEKDYANAEKVMRKAMEKYGNDPEMQNNLGNILFTAGRPQEAVIAFKKSVDLRPDKDYYYNLGCVYLTLNDPENALYNLNAARELDKTNDPKIRRMIDMAKQMKSAK